MATIYVGSARIGERGKYSGGTVGDQKQISSTNDTVGEVSMQTFYVHSKGWYIFRPKDVSVANAIASAMITACNNKNLGYDQSNRLGVIKYGVDTTTKTECDCSALVRACIIKATGKDVGNFTTATETTYLANSGLFENKIAYVNQSTTPVYNGDILVTKTSGHTVIVVSGNPRSIASIAPNAISHTQATENGWVQSNGKWYYFNENGSMVVNQWIKNTSGTWSYVNSSGEALIGWNKLFWNGTESWYYFDENGNMEYSTWIKSNGKDYYLTSSGAMATNVYVKSTSLSLYYWVGNDGAWQPEWDTSNPDLNRYKLVY